MPDDVLVAGGGPAGALAAFILARAGVRVRVFERGRYPRPKLCGDTLNPGALSTLARHLPIEQIAARAVRIDGMVLTGPAGARIEGRYGDGHHGLAITRAAFDSWLIDHASRAGAIVEEEVTVTGPIVAGPSPRANVRGLVVNAAAGTARHYACLTIAADGRRSRLAVQLGLAWQPVSPRRWAIGAYFDGVVPTEGMGEMHVRRGYYLGIAPVPGGLVNACLVVPREAASSAVRHPAGALAAAIAREPTLAERFARGRMVGTPAVLGPMAVDAAAAGTPGLLLAGDAAGFIDPMTGDGLALALRGAELAAAHALAVLGGRTTAAAAPARLAADRRRSFARKLRFNRALRTLVAWPPGVGAAAHVAHAWPGPFAEIIRFAGDCSSWTRPQRSPA